MKKSPFYFMHVKEGAVMGTGAWSSPQKYTDSDQEHHAVRNNIGVTDFSTMSKFDIQGPDAAAYLQKLIVNDICKLVPGKALYSCMTNEEGGMFDDTTVYMFNEEHYMLVGSTACRYKDIPWLNKHKQGMQVYVTDITSAYGLLSVQGPKSRLLLNEICAQSVDKIEYFHFIETQIDGSNVLLSRTGFTGEVGFELYIPSEDCPDIWEIVKEYGEKYDLKFVGMLAASGTLRLEKGYIGGKDYGEHTNPFEVGLGWTVAGDTEFIGSAALKKIRSEGVKKSLIGFSIADKSKIAANKADVLADGKVIGSVTSAALSPTYDVSFGMMFIDPEYAIIGNKIKIVVNGQQVDAEVAGKCLHDPEMKILKG